MVVVIMALLMCAIMASGYILILLLLLGSIALLSVLGCRLLMQLFDEAENLNSLQQCENVIQLQPPQAEQTVEIIKRTAQGNF